MNPDERFHGAVERVGGQIPWTWYVVDGKKELTVAWGEEFSQPMALRECRKATAGARWWHWYRRRPSEPR